MSQHPLYVMILWHMHQPYYKDLGNHQYLMPWVRLHATKDYLDMPLLAAEYPDLRVTFNMVPSLLEQIEDYAEDRAQDTYLDLARKRTEDLNEEERIQVLELFFSANYDRMIKPFARYRELFERRGWIRDRQEFQQAVHNFNINDLRDLLVWFYLAWTDPILRDRDKRLLALMAKERNFSETEKQEVLEITRKLTGQVIPTLKKLWADGNIEVSTTPFYHPILPLLIDTDNGRRARPRMVLPSRRFQHPEDAHLQIKMGLDYCEEKLGQRPSGMWPSEGSVCPELVDMFREEGVQWIATDEEVLACSLGGEGFWRDANGKVNNMEALYRPYALKKGKGQTAIFFRDRNLSDLIGFKYARWNPHDAAADMIRRLEEIQYMLRHTQGPHVVSIILDGENCWEHYEDDGVPFLRQLYQRLSTHDHLKTTTPTQYLTRFTKHHHLDRLHSGSWINHDYSIWIGHAEDNASWDLLSQARDDLHDKIHGKEAESIAAEARELAWKSLLVAEGSDWNWWYGDDHSSGIDDQFDALYRRHLINAYQALGVEPPARLHIPITSAGDVGLQTQPCAFLSPVLDGRQSNYYEWFSAGVYDPTHGGDSMHQTDHLVKMIYFGFDPKHFFLRSDIEGLAEGKHTQDRMACVVYLFSRKNYKIVIPFSGAPHKAHIYEEQGGEKGWGAAKVFEQVAIDNIVEMAFDFEQFDIQPDEMLRFQLALEVADQEIERCPSRTPLSTRIPNTDFEEEMWIV